MGACVSKIDTDDLRELMIAQIKEELLNHIIPDLIVQLNPPDLNKEN